MKILRSLSVVGAALLLAGCASGGGSDTSSANDDGGALETTTLTYGTFSTGLSSKEVLVADELGYFEDVGLEVEFNNVATTQALVPLLASGQVDMGYLSYQPAYSAVAAGVDLGLVDAVQALQDGMQALFVRKDSEIASLDDVKGKKIGLVSVGGYGDILLGEALDTVGLTIQDVELVEVAFPNMVSSLEQNVIDVAWLPSVFIPIAVNDKDERSKMLLDYNSVPSLNGLAQGGSVALKSFIEQNPNTVAAYREAVQRAADYLAENPDFDMQFNATALDVPEEILAGLTLPPYEGTVSVEDLQRVMDLQLKYDQLAGPVDVDAFASFQ